MVIAHIGIGGAVTFDVTTYKSYKLVPNKTDMITTDEKRKIK